MNQSKKDQSQSRDPNKPRKRKSEQLSDRDWKELMGQFNPTYGRHNGAIRQRGGN